MTWACVSHVPSSSSQIDDHDVYAYRANPIKQHTEDTHQLYTHQQNQTYQNQKTKVTSNITTTTQGQLHPASCSSICCCRLRFRFPQHNGDVFAFTDAVNQHFVHGVPRECLRLTFRANKKHRES